ncbi:hypothetical protein GLYMA_04G023600v4 [Glycine max]|uniref:TFIIS N-terminal domain-containing protein n=2 Tax=Glycine subgen. Soja TaxID=1462606 RepID=K7KHQ9_SOYBN|nr:uncharacterized protein LOC102669997 [Glycine max]XP_028227459.1 uncharacterized protein LOC114408569 [Glycine soja]KAG5047998.1 hypothetical protein JHK85_009101 [Glycine max]KAG5065123.1 hypothetical protein JHK86_008854 [Glycine max]KAH1109424.1 hypothetical protein GYH30_008707 [Glycine max]KAH1252265.1 hypothetical protein GmHk_04G009282 [Glycine max]KRH61029.1 hypothetical protein GLYMA_04G023600v4 [Glycine max]|eukprot:XP_006577965.1 uncharacterized protein LOC102669997 [Glycine max]
MTLEDFFTLSEMKDGLTAPSRVQELVSVMQKEKDSEVKNAADVTRQWAAVASTIAATENKDCLDLFIQLDGLCFINRWLKDAQDFGVDANDSFVEESITAMLRAVEKLHIDSEKSMSSGIRITVSNLLGHHSARVQDRARTLFDSWKGVGNGDTESHDVELAKVDNSSDKIVREETQPSAANEAGNDNDPASGLIGSEKSLLKSSDNLPVHSSDNVLQLSASVECIDIKVGSENHVAGVPSSAQEVAPAHEGLPICTTGETTSAGTCNFPIPNQSSFEGQSDVVQLSDLAKVEKQEQNINDPPEKLGAPEICSVSSNKPESEPVSMVACEAKAPESVKNPALEQNVEHNEDDVCRNLTNSASMRTPASDRSGEDDVTSITQVFKATENDNDCCSNALQGASVSDSNLGKTEVLDVSVFGTEYVTASKEGKGHEEDTSIGSDSSKPGIDFRSSNIIDKRGSDNELDCGIVDALEFARKIAQEVNREVSCSSEKVSEHRIRQPCSPDSVRKEDELTPVPPKEVSSRQSHATEACSMEGHVSILDNNEAEPECRPYVVSLEVTEKAQDSGGNSEKRLCGFDLNEVGADDMDVSVNTMSTPIPVVSASRPAPTPGLTGAPLQFEGTLGWKGSAATSAFRPASPRKNCDNDRNLSVDMNFDTSKQRQDWLDFDLNVAEGEEGNVKPTAESSGRPSGQSSFEFSPKKSSRLEFDLNSTGDDGDTQPSDQRMEGQLFLGRNGCWSPSPASSSSSMQPSVRNIDLNDRPCLQTDLVDQGPIKSAHLINAFGSKSSNAPVISLLGAKVEVGKKECVPQRLSLQNGKATEPAIELTMSRAGSVLGMTPTVPFNHSSVFGYNGVASASVTPAMSFSSAMYGSGGTIPYMVDSRGAPVVPQVGGSSSTVLSSYSQPPIFMNMAGTQLGLNGFGPSRPNFDLNSSFMIEGGNRDTLAARQFFFPVQGRAVEEQVRSMPQPSSSGVSGKRKEPDSGLEPYPFIYKNPQPPWK